MPNWAYRRVAVFAALFSIAGCAFGPVDEFSRRAVQYNMEAEQARNRATLLNIVRTSLRLPEEFSGVETVSGNATINGGGQISLPFGGGPRFANDTGQINGSVSGGPIFGVTMFDTQHFYEGILAPVQLKFVDVFNQYGYSRTELLNLFISRIVIRQPQLQRMGSTAQVVTKTLELLNNVGKDDDLDGFQGVVEYLINLGLTTKPEDKVTSFGPLLTPDEAKNVADSAKAAKAGLEIDEVQWCDISEDDRSHVLSRLKRNANEKLNADEKGITDLCNTKVEKKVEGDKEEEKWEKAFRNQIGNLPPVLYSVRKTDKNAKFCFDPRHKLPNDTSFIPNDAYCDKDATAEADLGKSPGSNQADKKKGSSDNKKENPRQPRSGLKLEGLKFGKNALGENSLVAALKANVKPDDWPEIKQKLLTFNSDNPVSIDLVPRSTEGIIYYLGEVVRRQLYPDYVGGNKQEKRDVMIKYGNPDEPIPEGRCNSEGQQFKMADDQEKAKKRDSSYRCVPIFKVVTDPKSPSLFAVDYNGKTIALPRDENDGKNRDAKIGRTYQALDIVTQLVAVNKKATEIPTTSVFSLISH